MPEFDIDSALVSDSDTHRSWSAVFFIHLRTGGRLTCLNLT